MALFDFASWLRQAFPKSQRKGKRAARRKNTQPLTLERLEDRTVPSGLSGGTIFLPQNRDGTGGAVIDTEAQFVKGGQTLLQFTDTNSNPLSNLTAVITWGDGTMPFTTGGSGTAIIVHDSGTTYEVQSVTSGAHQYEEVPAGTNFDIMVTDSSDHSSIDVSTPFSAGVTDIPVTVTPSVHDYRPPPLSIPLMLSSFRTDRAHSVRGLLSESVG